jgi:5,5'-dehydrodivanillate O-demethylase
VEKDAIRCFYHGWKFSPSGECLEMPCEKESFVRKVKIRAYPVREYLGLIFAWFGEGEPPEFPRYPELEEDNGYPLSNSRWDLPHNFFQRMENDLDEAHVNFVHKTQADLALELSVLPQFDAEETDYGILRIGTRHRGATKDVRYSHMLMPNTTLIVVPPSTQEDNWAVHLAWRVPASADKTVSLVASRRKIHAPAKEAPAWPPVDYYVKEVLEGRMRMRDIDPAHPLLFNIQDNVVLLAQGAVYDDRDTERLGQSDAAVILLRKLYERELKALIDGKPVKDWKRPKERLQLGFHEAEVA